MKLKTRLLTPLFAVLMLGTATSAFADLTCSVTATIGVIPGAVPRGIVNGHTENTADLLFNCTPVGTLSPGTATTDASITVYYGGLPITNTTALPVGHTVSVVNTTGALAAVLDTTRVDTGTTAVSQGSSLVAILLPAQAVPAAGTFELRNVLLSLSGATIIGQTVAVNVNVLSGTGNTTITFPATPPPGVVIGSVQQMLNATPALTVNPLYPTEAIGAAQFTSSGLVLPPSINCSSGACQNARASFAVSVAEDHVDSWRSPATYYNNLSAAAPNGTNIQFTFSGMLPGSIISNCVLTPLPAGNGQVWNLTGSGIAGTAGTTTFVAEPLVVPPTTILGPGSLDSLTLTCGTGMANPAYLPGQSSGSATTNITVTAQPAPIGLNQVPPATGANAGTGGVPRYNATGGTVGPVTVVNFGAASTGQTTMLIPYALANVGTYDTGISIANTTKDPVFGTTAQGSATDTSGNLTFHFFPGDGSANFSITPASGFNLVNGQVPSGNSFIGTLSSILRADNRTAAFQGYIIAVANFTHGHGTAYVYGGTAADRLTSATDVLVISNPLGINTGRDAFATTVGSVEQVSK